jgi:glycerol-1-phosphate dehydrogenase [NAD(P)+]
MMMSLQEGNWQEIRDALKKIGAPTTARELGIEAKYIIEALLQAPVSADRYNSRKRPEPDGS